MSDTNPGGDEQVRAVFAECMKPRYRAPCGVCMRESGELYATGSDELRSRVVVAGFGVCLANAAFMIGFAYLVTEQGVIRIDHRPLLIALACVWGVLVGGLVLAIRFHQMGKADKMTVLLHADERRIASPNGDWSVPREQVSSLIAWVVVTRDKGANQVRHRFEFLTVETQDGALLPVFVTKQAINSSRKAVRDWCERHTVPLKEFKPTDADRPWTADVPFGLQAS